jgi:hypothetical protein
MGSVTAAIPHVTARDDRMKRCCMCGEWLPVTCFHRLRSAADGRRGSCRACRSEYRAGLRPATRAYRRKAAQQTLIG